MISVIIPAYNAEKLILKCLKALENQTVLRTEYEILVVDDGSTDNTAEIVKSFEEIRLIQQKNQGPAAARNNGARQANGNIILFTDSDCIPAKNWIEEMICPFENDREVVGTKGTYRTDQKELTARFVQMEYEDKYDLLSKHKFIDFVDTYSAGFKKDIFLSFNGYDTSFPVACAEDVELSFRMSEKRCKIIFNPKAVVTHIHPKKFMDYLRKKYKFAFWRILAVKKNPRKIIKDSHTPQIMKFQLFFLPIFGLSILLMIFSIHFYYATIGIIIIFIFSSLGFILKTIKKDMMVGLLSLFFLLGRSMSQSLGVFNGMIHHFILNKN
jgi:glycosyltransferase involved in cell wall biosynthesis